MVTKLNLKQPPTESRITVPAFGVFAGGGAKAAVFPGCLAAAREWNIEFQGYGGSSGGAIVAALAAAGYTAEEIRDKLIEVDLREVFLRDKGQKLRSLAKMVEALGHQVQKTPTQGGLLRTPHQFSVLLRVVWGVSRLLAKFGTDSGLYSAAEIRAFINRHLQAASHIARYQQETDNKRITFGTLRDAMREKPYNFLKILTTDLRHQRPRIFGDRGNLDFEVATAVAASASYPFVFQPVNIGDALAVDAGLSANLPVHLFEDERLEYRWPVIAFDLQSDAGDFGDNPSIPDLAYRLLTTALEASEQPLRAVLKSVIYIRIPDS